MKLLITLCFILMGLLPSICAAQQSTEARLARIEEALTQMNKRMDNLNKRIDDLRGDMNIRLANVDSRIATLERGEDDENNRLQSFIGRKAFPHCFS